MTFAPGVGCPRWCASRSSCERSRGVVISANTVFPTDSVPSARGSSSRRPVTSNDMSPSLRRSPASPKLRPRQNCPKDERRARICCMATRVSVLTETADATKPCGVGSSDTPPASAALLRLQLSGAGAKFAISLGCGRADSPAMSLVRTFTARAKARARPLQLLARCGADSDAAFGAAVVINRTARIGMRATRIMAGSSHAPMRQGMRRVVLEVLRCFLAWRRFAPTFATTRRFARSSSARTGIGRTSSLRWVRRWLASRRRAWSRIRASSRRTT